MANTFFRFKKFCIHHDKCAMKVGTDGVLVGICANLSNISSILDIGTGTGLISLMLAQRSADQINIDAIDIDENAIIQANENILASPFSNIYCTHSSLQDFSSDCDKKYDLIVSNPPYFSDSLQSPDKQRTLARHTESLNINDFFQHSSSLLSQNGRIFVIFPYLEKDLLIKAACQNNLYPSQVIRVYSTTTSSQPKRILVEFSFEQQIITTKDLTIESDRHIYTSEFSDLAKDFYIKL